MNEGVEGLDWGMEYNNKKSSNLYKEQIKFNKMRLCKDDGLLIDDENRKKPCEKEAIQENWTQERISNKKLDNRGNPLGLRGKNKLNYENSKFEDEFILFL